MNNLADVIDRAAAVLQSLGVAPGPVLQDGHCALCCLNMNEREHDPECGWVLARKASSNDVSELQRLARVLRYDGSPVTR